MQIKFDARPLYRVMRDMAYSRDIVLRGAFHRLEKIDEMGIARLLERRAIAIVSSPPLSVLPGWKARSARLEESGIDTATQFLGADSGAVAILFGRKKEIIEKWKREVACLLGATDSNGRRR